MLLVAAPVLNHVLGNKDVFTPLVGSSLLQERVIGPVSGGEGSPGYCCWYLRLCPGCFTSSSSFRFFLFGLTAFAAFHTASMQWLNAAFLTTSSNSIVRSLLQWSTSTPSKMMCIMSYGRHRHTSKWGAFQGCWADSLHMSWKSDQTALCPTTGISSCLYSNSATRRTVHEEASRVTCVWVTTS